MSIEKAKIINFPRISDHRGSLSFIENERHIPFKIQRIYYLYDTPCNKERGAHGHKKLEQIIIAISGSFNFVLNDGYKTKTFSLKNPWEGLYVPPMMWRDLNNFSLGAVCLVLGSELYTEDDYYRNYEDFLKDVKK